MAFWTAKGHLLMGIEACRPVGWEIRTSSACFSMAGSDGGSGAHLEVEGSGVDLWQR